MKKGIKITLCIFCLCLAAFLLPASCFYYVTNWKQTVRDISLSPEGDHELILIELGEPEWPFGSASGRLVLKEDATQIARTDFRVQNDGCSISSGCWKVFWSETYVKVILSGEEQFDEQILLYFDGTVERHSLNGETDQSMQERIKKRCEEIVSLYANTEKTDTDAIENLLLDAGLDVMDSNDPYPSYLTTADNFYEFWECVEQGKDAEQEIIMISPSGTLSYRLFTFDETGAFYYSMEYKPDGLTAPYYEKQEIKDWVVTEKGHFFYRIYLSDSKHYPDYTLIRLTPPDTTLYDMTLQFILPVNYIATNLFLTDWSEMDWGELSFNDQFEYLYYTEYGRQFSPDGYSKISGYYGYGIPAEEFEEIVLPYFRVDLETFRQLAHYDSEENCYPWRPLTTNDFVKLWYYEIVPEVTAYTVNSDGTITLTVEVLSTDLKMDCLFAHEVRIRQLEDGQFQYVGNKVTYQTDYGLPYCEPRINWGNLE